MTAMIVQSEARSAPAGLGVRIARAVAALVSALAAEYRARQASKALYELNDHMLADIGLSRSEIETAVRHGRRAITLRRMSRIDGDRRQP